MSNPGVIYLASQTTKSGGSFRVEDNIGEAIHLHYENFRIDLSIKDFLKLCDIIEDSLGEFLDVPGFNIKNYDPLFLSGIGAYLYDLRKVRFENIPLNRLQIVRKGILGLPVVSSLSKSRITRALIGDTIENDSYIQNNFYSQSNQERLLFVKEKVTNDGYPYNEEYIVLFNNQNLIRDGQHRAAIMFHNDNETSVTVIRLIFKDNKYNLSMYPWLDILSLTKTIIKKIVNKCHKYLMN